MRVAASADLIDDREYAAPRVFDEVVAPTRLSFHVPVLADAAPIVRHRKLAAIGWSQTAPRLVAYLERRTSWDS